MCTHHQMSLVGRRKRKEKKRMLCSEMSACFASNHFSSFDTTTTTNVAIMWPARFPRHKQAVQRQTESSFPHPASTWRTEQSAVCLCLSLCVHLLFQASLTRSLTHSRQQQQQQLVSCAVCQCRTRLIGQLAPPLLEGGICSQQHRSILRSLAQSPQLSLHLPSSSR